MFVFEKEEDGDALSDYLIYEKDKKGQRLIDQFYDSDIELTDDEEEFLEGQINNYPSLFEVVKTDSLSHTVLLKDILNKDMPEVTMFDVGVASTGMTGFIFYTRLLPIQDVYISSGVSL